MEKKKLLLVAISVGVFLVISIVAAILVFQPRNASSGPLGGRQVQATQTGTNASPPPSYQNPPSTYVPGSSQNVPVDAVDLMRNPSDVPGLRPAPEGMVRQNSDYYVNPYGTSSDTVINVPKPSSAAVPDAAPAGKAVPTQRPAASGASASSPAVAAKPQPKPTVIEPKVDSRPYNDFWVQTGAFSTISKAEGVKETLATKGITSIIENRDVNGRTLFRVRVGPYTSQNEANYWLSLIKSISGFEESQVRQTQRR